MNRADIESLITDINDGGLNTAEEVRDVLNGLLDSVYDDVVSENTSGTLNITTAGSNFTYNLYFQKVGKFISVTGNFNVTTSSSSGEVILTIDDSDWLAEINSFSSYRGSAINGTNDSIDISVYNNEMIINNSVLSGEQYRIKALLYNAAN